MPETKIQTKKKEDPAVRLGDVLPEVTQGIKPEPPRDVKPETYSSEQEQQFRQPAETPQDDRYSVRKPTELETRLYEKIVEELPETTRSMYFSNVSVLEIDSNSKKVFVSVPYKGNINLIEDRYRSHLLESISDVLGEGYNVDFKIDLPLFQHLVPIDRMTKSSKPAPTQKSTQLEKEVEMPYDCTFRNVGLHDGNKRALVTLRRIYADVVHERSSGFNGKIIALLGEPEIGKKHHVSALANTLAKKGFDSWYLNLNNLSRKLNDTKGEFNKKLKPPKGIRVAIFDDIDGCFKGKSPRPGTQRGFLKCLNLIKSSSEKTQIIFTGKENPKKLAKKLRGYDLTLSDEDTRKGVATALASKIEGVTRIYMDHPSSKEEARQFISGLVRNNCRSRKELETFLDFYMPMLPDQPKVSEVTGDTDTIKNYLGNYGNLRLTPENATEALRSQGTFFDPKDLPGILVDIVTEKNGLTKEQLEKKSRKRELVNARREAFFALREFTNLPLEDIAALFKKTHTSVSYSINKIEEEKRKKLKDEIRGELLNRGVRLESLE